MKRITIMLFLLAIGASVNESFAQKKPKPTPTPVSSTIADVDANSIPFDIQSDGGGVYVGGVDSIVAGVGNGWELSLLSSPTRTAEFSFGDPVSVPAGKNPPPDGSYRTRFLSQCFTGNLVDLIQTSTLDCNLIVAIDVGAERYSLRFYEANYPGTNDVQWTCTGAGSDGKCNAWRVQSPNGNKLIAQLVTVTTVRGKNVTTDYGRYRFSFDISVTR
jgi:hypothetical protein